MIHGGGLMVGGRGEGEVGNDVRGDDVRVRVGRL